MWEFRKSHTETLPCACSSHYHGIQHALIQLDPKFHCDTLRAVVKLLYWPTGSWVRAITSWFCQRRENSTLRLCLSSWLSFRNSTANFILSLQHTGSWTPPPPGSGGSSQQMRPQPPRTSGCGCRAQHRAGLPSPAARGDHGCLTRGQRGALAQGTANPVPLEPAASCVCSPEPPYPAPQGSWHHSASRSSWNFWKHYLFVHFNFSRLSQVPWWC